MLGEPPSPPPLCRGGQSDHTTALNILAAVLAALRLRDQTDLAQHVEVTLQGTGMYTIATDLQAALIAREQPRRHDRTRPPNPIWNSYRCGDGEWLLLVMPQPDPYSQVLHHDRQARMGDRPALCHVGAAARKHDRADTSH